MYQLSKFINIQSLEYISPKVPKHSILKIHFS
jgi:hypothetical protein